MKKCLGLCLVAAISGCAGVAVKESVSDVASVGASNRDTTPMMKTESALNAKYGIWVGKGPKILSSDGKPLFDAKVTFSDDSELRYLALDEDARLVVNRYLSNKARRSPAWGYVNVFCPGYCSKKVVPLYNECGLIDEIRLEKADQRTSCRGINAMTSIFDLSKPTTCGFDLVDGDWLPPRGWGRVEDVRIHFFDDAAPDDVSASYILSVNGVRPDGSAERHSPKVTRLEFLNSGDGYGEDVRTFSDCTNRVLVIDERFHRPPFGFKVRGRTGRFDSVSRQLRRDYRRDAKTKKGGSFEWAHVQLIGQLNEEAGASSSEKSPRGPFFHPVPQRNAMAFGVSADGRSAVCFGWTKTGAKVPEIFEKGVYTVSPATDLPGLETLYLDPSSWRQGTVPQINGLPELRSLIVAGIYHLNLGARAFAENPKLDTVVFAGYGTETIVAGNTFEGCAKDLVAVYSEERHEFPGEWTTMAVTNVFTGMCKVEVRPTDAESCGDSSISFPEVDVFSGRVELPVLRRSEGYFEKEYSDGRIQRFNRDGSVEKLRR